MKTNLPINPKLLSRLEELGFTTPTPIQEHTWKYLIEKHQDYVGQAHTGSGKTIAYGVPLLQRIDAKDKDVQAVVLVPTRELVIQTTKTLFKLSKNLDKFFIQSIVKGDDIEEQARNLKRPTHVLVATPGRLLELVRMKAVSLHRVKTIVLDEADELYAKGFMKEIDKILGMTNDFHKKWLFSATIHGELTKWIKNTLHADAPQAIIATKKVMNPRIEHQYLECQKEDKPMMLLEFLSTMKKGRGIVFCRTKGDVEHIARFLRTHELKVTEIYGEMFPKEREKAMRMFLQEKTQYLVASDIAARGMDFPDLAFVVHYQLPDDPDYYTHRSGRTARAGKRGISLSLIEPVERKKLRYIQELLNVDFIQL
ncbi:MAG: box helicase domain protein [Fluviicola sp.]|jgi:ATP-dependent RNA helicase DeaD|uniref:DEAD/DEAH box helicase n=1 Tax=Fluviicola sp. TaxID=1917219 RepID=UPI002628296B|nr:DEAD/DEAH box helicase [Fluviicola sp.]MDF3026692.1 box helicase domain protein [Fluviicola sp.]